MPKTKSVTAHTQELAAHIEYKCVTWSCRFFTSLCVDFFLAFSFIQKFPTSIQPEMSDGQKWDKQTSCPLYSSENGNGFDRSPFIFKKVVSNGVA